MLRTRIQEISVWQQWARRIGGILFAVALINFAAFSIHALILGGGAINGEVVDGRYYVRNHGQKTEVTEWQWRMMRVHEISVFITHPLGLFVGGMLLLWVQFSNPQDPAYPPDET